MEIVGLFWKASFCTQRRNSGKQTCDLEWALMMTRYLREERYFQGPDGSTERRFLWFFGTRVNFQNLTIIFFACLVEKVISRSKLWRKNGKKDDKINQLPVNYRIRWSNLQHLESITKVDHFTAPKMPHFAPWSDKGVVHGVVLILPWNQGRVPRHATSE